MFQRLFGETEAEQLQYLQPRVIGTAVCAALGVVSMIFEMLSSFIAPLAAVAGLGYSLTYILLFILFFVWGFGAIKALFGIGSIGAIFSGNVVLGVVIFFICILAAYLICIIAALLGIGRYIYLRVQASTTRG